MTSNLKRFDRRKLKNVEVFINFDGTLENATCSRIVEDFLKYVLYQRHVIPIHYEGLNREMAILQQKLNKEDTAETSKIEEKSDEVETSDTFENLFKPKVYHTRDEIVKRKEKKVQMRRLCLLTRLVDSYRAVVKVLKPEIESGNVSAVCFILGSTIFSAKEAFLLYLPDEFENQSNLTDRKAIIHLFRNLVVNEELLQFISRPCQNQKLWIMLQKRNTEYDHSSSEESVSTKEESESLLPRPDYCFPTRTRIVHVWMSCSKIMGLEGTSNEMVLTPCADKIDHLELGTLSAGYSRESKMRSTHANVRFALNRSGSGPVKRESICRSISESDNEPRSDTAVFKTPFKPAKCAFETPARPRNFTSVAGTPCDSHDICNLVETPNLSRIYSGTEPLAMDSDFGCSHLTPGQGGDGMTPLVNKSCRLPRSPLVYSPVKSLANTIDHFSISAGEKREQSMWFQIQDPILGFKNCKF